MEKKTPDVLWSMHHFKTANQITDIDKTVSLQIILIPGLLQNIEMIYPIKPLLEYNRIPFSRKHDNSDIG